MLGWAILSSALVGCLAGHSTLLPSEFSLEMAFMVVFTVLMLLLLGAVFYIMREHTAKHQERQKWGNLQKDKEEVQQIKEEALKARGKAGQGQGRQVWELVQRKGGQ